MEQMLGCTDTAIDTKMLFSVDLYLLGDSRRDGSSDYREREPVHARDTRSPAYKIFWYKIKQKLGETISSFKMVRVCISLAVFVQNIAINFRNLELDSCPRMTNWFSYILTLISFMKQGVVSSSGSSWSSWITSKNKFQINQKFYKLNNYCILLVGIAEAELELEVEERAGKATGSWISAADGV